MSGRDRRGERRRLEHRTDPGRVPRRRRYPRPPRGDPRNGVRVVTSEMTLSGDARPAAGRPRSARAARLSNDSVGGSPVLARRSFALAALTGLCLAASAGASIDAALEPPLRVRAAEGLPGPARLALRLRAARPASAAAPRSATPTAPRSSSAPSSRVRTRRRGSGRCRRRRRLGSASANVDVRAGGPRLARSSQSPGPRRRRRRSSCARDGFSQRVRPTSREVSFGIVLANPSPEMDALDVAVLVNFVDSTNRVVATKTRPHRRRRRRHRLLPRRRHLDPGQDARLEARDRAAHRQPAAEGACSARPRPTSSCRPSRYEPGWVGAVVGQVLNDHPTWLLARAPDLDRRLRLGRQRDRRQHRLRHGRPPAGRPGVLQRLVGDQLDPVRPGVLGRRVGARAATRPSGASAQRGRGTGRSGR